MGERTCKANFTHEVTNELTNELANKSASAPNALTAAALPGGFWDIQLLVLRLTSFETNESDAFVRQARRKPQP